MACFYTYRIGQQKDYLTRLVGFLVIIRIILS